MPKENVVEDDDLELEGHESEFEDPVDADDDSQGDEGDLTPSNKDESDEDERLVSGEEGEEEEDERQKKIRENRRNQRKRAKELRHAREMNYRAEISARDQLLEQMRQRLESLENRGQSSFVASIDNQINQLAQEYVSARDAVAKGTDEQNGQLVAQATERMQQIRIQAEQLAARKEAIQRQEQQRRMNPQPQAPDPRLKLYADRWMEENAWFNPSVQNRETMTVRTVDEALSREGWNPNTPEYWEELTERVKKALPNRYREDYNQTQRTPAKSIVSGSSRAASSANSQPYRLSPERVEAMKELGIWDDPKKRAAMIAEYKKYDKEHKAA